MAFKDISGKTTGALTVTNINEKRKNTVYWLCACECGGKRWLSVKEYESGRFKSCGCGTSRKNGSIQYIVDGGFKSKIHTVWRAMISRCYNKNNNQFKGYGGRGIKVCDEWLNSFEQFYKDMGNLPFDGAELDRIDNDDGYYKENCRWVTSQQNIWNQGARVGGSSKYKGVKKDESPNKGTRWISSISRTLNGEYTHKSKTFNTEIEAAEWYNEQAKELFGEYAYLNKIDYSEKE